MSLKRKAVSAANAAALMAFFSLGTLARECRKRSTTSFGNTTQAQILDKTERMCGRIIPITRPANLKTDRLTSYDRNGAAHHFWSVDCDNGYRDLLHFCWDADSGEISSASRHIDGDLQSPEAAMSRSRALRYAKYWLRRLEIPKAGEVWRAANSSELIENRWRVTCASKKRIAFIVIDAATGDFVTAKVAGIGS